MATYKCFEELPIWKSAKDLALAIYKATNAPLFNKDFVLVRQTRASALSVSSNIAEGFERGTSAELLQFLYIARGSCGELRSQLAIAAEIGYISSSEFQGLRAKCEETSNQIGGFISYLKNSKLRGHKYAGVISEEGGLYISEDFCLTETSNSESGIRNSELDIPIPELTK